MYFREINSKLAIFSKKVNLLRAKNYLITSTEILFIKKNRKIEDFESRWEFFHEDKNNFLRDFKTYVKIHDYFEIFYISNNRKEVCSCKKFH